MMRIDKVDEVNKNCQKVVEISKSIVQMLVQQQYGLLDDFTCEDSLTAIEALETIKSLNWRLAAPPPSAYESICYLRSDGQEFSSDGKNGRHHMIIGESGGWWVDMDMWIEGSDEPELTLKLDIGKLDDEVPHIQIVGLYVS